MFGKWVMRLAAILVVAMAAPLARAIPEPRATILRQEDGQTGYKDLSENQSVAGKKLSDALPGQYMDLKVVYYPIDNNVTVKAYRWEIDGTNFKDWQANRTKGELIPWSKDGSEFKNETVQFYWANAGAHTAKCTLTLSNGGTVVGEGTVNVEKPTVTFTVAMGTVVKGTNHGATAVGLFSSGGKNPDPGGTPTRSNGDGGGIVWTGQVQMPNGWPADIGKWNWVQLTSMDRYRVHKDADGVPHNERLDGNGTEYLDTTYPYEPAPYMKNDGDPIGRYASGAGTGDVHKNGDSPATPVDTDDTTKEVRNERFRTWLMFLPDDAAKSRYVPTKICMWQWGGKITLNNGTWGDATNTHPSKPTLQETIEHPVWNGNAEDHQNWVADKNALTLTVPANVGPGRQVFDNGGKVQTSANVTTPLVIRLSCSNNPMVVIPDTVTIPAGTNSVQFTVTVPANTGKATDVTFFAQAADYSTGTAPMTISHSP